MSNKSGAIGTKTATHVARTMAIHGFPLAERRTLRGCDDWGDINTGNPRLVIQVKGGHAAESASDAQVASWLEITDKQRASAGADIGILVLKRKGVGYANADRWWAILTARDIVEVQTGHDPGPRVPHAVVRLVLADACALLCRFGYGGPLAHEEASRAR